GRRRVGTGHHPANFLRARSPLHNHKPPGLFHGHGNHPHRDQHSPPTRRSADLVKLYATERNNRGIAAVSIDGGPETNVDLYSAADAGDVLVFTSPTLTAGAHPLTVRNTSTHNAARARTIVSLHPLNLTPTAVTV